MADPMKKRGERLKAGPFPDQPIMRNGWGYEPVPGGLKPHRSAAPLPSESRGPINARQVRADKGLRGYGDPSWMTPTSPATRPKAPRR